MIWLNLQITIMEHTLSLPKSGRHVSSLDTCDSYYSNVGPVKECVSATEMNIKSAKRGHRTRDHLSKKERRALKKAEIAGNAPTDGKCT